MIEEMIRGGNKTKIDRYKWTVKDETGEIRQLNKSVLKVDHEYQRNASDRKVLALANSWSWIACGAIVVGQRDNTYWVIDGQHRVLAARRRADIEMLPCLIFQSDGVASEARGFWHSNTGHRQPSSFDVYRARLAAEDPIAIYVSEVFDKLKLVPCGTTSKVGQIKAVKWCLLQAEADKELFVDILTIVNELSDGVPIIEILLLGMQYLRGNISENEWRKKIRPRALAIGGALLIDACKRAAAYHSGGGAKVYGIAILNQLNKGLRNKIAFSSGDDVD